MTLTFTRAGKTYKTLYQALSAKGYSSAEPLTLLIGHRPASLEALRELRRSLELCHRPLNREDHCLLAFIRAQEAAQEEPTGPDFPVPAFPECLSTQRGERNARDTLRATIQSMLFLSAATTYPALEMGRRELNGRQSVLHYTWEEAQGFMLACTGWMQVSPRPYRVTDKCDGSRDDEAYYTLFSFLHQMGLSFEQSADLYRRAYEGERDNEFSVPLVWYSAYWREHAVRVPPLTRENFAALLRSLYDMNHRSLSCFLEETLLPTLDGEGRAA